MSIKFLISVFVCASAIAGPVDFALDEYHAALAARNLKWKVKYELTPDPPETYRIEPYAYGGAHITGGDLRGLMYGLLEAADQIRATGRMKQVRGEPAATIRGVRMFARDADFDEAHWRVFSDPRSRPLQSLHADLHRAAGELRKNSTRLPDCRRPRRRFHAGLLGTQTR